MRRLLKDLWIILLLLFFFEGPFRDYFWFLYLDPRLDVDVAQSMASEAFEERNPGFLVKGGRMLSYDPFAYTIEVQGYGYERTKGKWVTKTEVYRIYWWGEVVKLPLGALPLVWLRIIAISGVALIVVELGRWLIPHLSMVIAALLASVTTGSLE